MKRYLDLVPIAANVRKKQSRMSIICIILGVLLVTTIFGMADMFVRSQIQQTKNEEGNWHIRVSDITEEDAGVLAARPDVEALSFYNVLNYRGDQDYTLEDKNAAIVGSDETFVTDIFSGMLVDGEFPGSATEALVSRNAKDMLGLARGDQIQVAAPDDRSFSFTISGFLENTAAMMSNDAYAVLLSREGFQTLASRIGGETDNMGNLFYLQFSNTRNVSGRIAEVTSAFHLTEEQVAENVKLLGLLGQSTSSFMMQIYASASVLFVLVLCAAIMMITSSLNSNVARRTEFFGLLRCVGATPKQVMRLVRKEALRWCRFAIPIGVGSGIIIIWILCAILRTLSPVYFAAMPILSISMPSIAAGIVLGLLTVLLSARSPAKKAAKVSPLAAVSGNASDLQPVRKAASTRLFKIDAALGIHHAKSSRKNFILTVISFALSIVLFLSFSVAITFIKHALRPLYPWTADISIVSTDQTNSVNGGFIQELEKHQAVDSVYGRMFQYDVPITVNGESQTIDLVSYEERQLDWSASYMQEGSLDDVLTKRNTGLIVHNSQGTLEVGDVVAMDIGGKQTDIEIVGLLSTSPFQSTDGSAIIICSEDTFRETTGQDNYTIIDMQLTDNATDADINEIRRTYGEGYSFIDDRIGNESVIGVYYCVWLFLYGFLVLIALITVFNVVNTIALSVSARTKQYGAFRAIGLSTRQLTKMVIAEASAYTIVGSFLGAVLGLLLHKLLFGSLINYKWGDPWMIPWGELGIIVLIMVFSVGLSVYGPIKKIHKMSIVETISAQ